MLGCIFNPAGCVSDAFNAIPLEWLLGAAFVAGLILGAALGRWAVAALLGVLGGVAVFRWMGGKPVTTEEQYGEPEVRRKPIGKEIFPGKERKKGETAADRWEARE